MHALLCDLPYHQQDTPNGCGLATAQMLLAQLDVNKTAINQNLLASKTNVSVGGISDADLCDLLKNVARQHFGSDFGFSPVDGSNCELEMRRIADTLFSTRVAVPALILGGDPHWVAVGGVVVDGDARAGGNYTISGFFIANPFPQTAIESNPDDQEALQGPPPPHQRHDLCGRGNQFGANDIYVSAAAWRLHYWPPDARCVTITNARSPSNSDLAGSPIHDFVPPATAGSPLPADDDESAKAAALAGLRAHGLDQVPPFAGVLAGASPTQVDSHETEVSPYDVWYLVTFTTPANLPVASVFVQKGSGQFLGAMAPQAPTKPPFELQIAVFDAIATEAPNFSDLLGSEPLKPDDVVVKRPRFWRPCAESKSPFYAFAEVRVRGKKLYFAYGGGIHRRLHRGRCTGTRRRVTRD